MAIGKKENMDQQYSHHHVKEAHHTGLIIGTIAGSTTVAFIAAIAMVIYSPKLIINPFSFTSQVKVNAPVSNGETGALGQDIEHLDLSTPGNPGLAGQGVANSIDQ